MKLLAFVLLLIAALVSGKPVGPIFYSSGFVPGFQPFVGHAPFTTYTYVAGAPNPTPLVPTPYSAAPASGPGPVSVVAPIVAPIAAPVAVAPNRHSFHTQDGKGAYSFGYYGGPSSRAESRDNFGNVRGAYNYVDANGEIQSAQYSAGPEGFNVAASNLPVAPKSHGTPADPAVDVISRKKRSADPAFYYSSSSYQAPPAILPVPQPLTYSAVSPVPTPLTYAAPFPQPLTYSAQVPAPLTYPAFPAPIAPYNNYPYRFSTGFHNFYQTPVTHFGPAQQYKAGTAKLQTASA